MKLQRKLNLTRFVLHVICLLVEFCGVDHIVRFAEEREIQELVLHVVFLAESDGVAVSLSAREKVNRLADPVFACYGYLMQNRCCKLKKIRQLLYNLYHATFCIHITISPVTTTARSTASNYGINSGSLHR